MEKVSKLLEKRSMIPAELSRLTGIATGRLSKLSQGKGQLRLPEALRVARALNVSLDYLADEDSESPDQAVSEDDRVILLMARDLGYAEARRRLLRSSGPIIEVVPDPPASRGDRRQPLTGTK